ncbi:MAG: hypothetical protein HY291_23075, partial [Planctomycetes bacterium]|nr:hypothetical protein [Planctomycetota bacterium]
MRQWIWWSAALTLCWLAPHLAASESTEGVPDIVKMAENGVGEDIMLAYIETAPSAYEPNVDEIIMLHDLGVSSKVISAMIEHGRIVRLQRAKAPEGATLPPPTPAVPEPLPPEPPAPEPEEEVTPIQYAPGEGPVYEYEQPEAARIVEAAPVSTVIYESSQPNVVYVPPDEGLNVSYFYESLSPYGRWMLLPGHGWVWQPTVVRVDPNWRPYFNSGHWVWTDHGWYWSSSYSWGWAPFHYGRWAYVQRYGWIWEPDTEWGPAWVHWRRSDDHCGWAPLPPGSRFEVGIGFSFRGKHVALDFNFNLGERDYAFVPVNRFAERDLAPVAVRRDRARTVYNNTTIINNTYIYNDNRVINQGMPVASVAAATKQDFKPVQISAAKVAAGDAVAGEQQQPGQITVFRPKLQAQNTVDPQQAVALREAFQSRWQQEQKSGAVIAQRQKELAGQGVASDEAKRQAERDARKKVFEDVAKLPPAQLPAAKLVDPATVAAPKKPAAPSADEAKRRADWEAKRKADEARRAADDASKKTGDAARQQADAAKKAADEAAAEAKKKGEGDQAKRRVDLEAQARKQAEEAKKKADEAARQQADAAKMAADEAADEAKKKGEGDQAKRRVDLEAQAHRQAEEAKKKADEGARQQADAAKKAADEAADEAKKKGESDQSKRRVDLEAQARRQ